MVLMPGFHPSTEIEIYHGGHKDPYVNWKAKEWPILVLECECGRSILRIFEPSLELDDSGAICGRCYALNLQ